MRSFSCKGKRRRALHIHDLSEPSSSLIRAAMAVEMETSRAQLNRVLDPEASNVTLDTLSRAARVLGRELKVELA